MLEPLKTDHGSLINDFGLGVPKPLPATNGDFKGPRDLKIFRNMQALDLLQCIDNTSMTIQATPSKLSPENGGKKVLETRLGDSRWNVVGTELPQLKRRWNVVGTSG